MFVFFIQGVSKLAWKIKIKGFTTLNDASKNIFSFLISFKTNRGKIINFGMLLLTLLNEYTYCFILSEIEVYL